MKEIQKLTKEELVKLLVENFYVSEIGLLDLSGLDFKEGKF